MSNDLLHESVARVVDAANKHKGYELTPLFHEALNDLAGLTLFSREEILPRVASALSNVTSPSGAGFIAVWLGASVEHGADPCSQTQPLLDCFLRFARLVKTDVEGGAEVENDDELVRGLELLGQSLVSHLSRDTYNLQSVRSNHDIVEALERIEPYSVGALWVLALISKMSGTLIVLHGEQLVGAKVAYRNISNCFHLFTLLQATLEGVMPGARKVSPDILAAALGESMESCYDEAWWHYGQPVSGSPNIVASVFGEQHPSGIHAIGGEQVMLLWPPILKSRQWDSGFFGPALQQAPPEVELIAMLPMKEVTMWRERIGLHHNLFRRVVALFHPKS